MKRKIKRVLGIVLSAALLATSVPVTRDKINAANECSVELNVTYGQTEARSMLAGINSWRTSDTWLWNSDNMTKATVSGRKALKYDARLERIAMQRAAEIALSFSHTRPSGEDTWSAYGNINDYGYVAENIAAGQRTAEAALNSWKEENEDYSGQGHRRNMLNENLCYIGIGHVCVNGINYWVQEFSAYSNDETQGEANDSDTTVSLSVSDGFLASAKVTIVPETISLNMSDNISSVLPQARTAICVYDAWPSRYTILEKPLPQWKIASGDSVKLEGQNIKAVSEGTTVLTATVEIAGTEYSADCNVTVSSAVTTVTPSSITVKDTPVPTQSPTVTKKPVATAKITATKKPVATAKITATKKPAATKKPEATKKPVATRKPTAQPTKKPVKRVGKVKVKNKKGKKIAVSWEYVFGASSYNVQCSLNKKFTRVIYNESKTKTKCVIKYLKKKKKYYIRARAYKESSESFGRWSKVKKIKVKK